MCLIVLAWQAEPRHALIVAANRDEFHGRAAAPARFWDDPPGILAGRDLEAMGTWLGVARDGRFASVTNYRGAHEPRAAESRGRLVTRFLAGAASPRAYAAQVAARGDDYSGFNLLLADHAELWWLSNRGGTPRRLEPGLHALGNDLLDTPETASHLEAFRRRIARSVSVEALFDVLAPARIVAPLYGTRCSSVLLRGADGRIEFAERAYDAAGAEGETVRFEFGAAAAAAA